MNNQPRANMSMSKKDFEAVARAINSVFQPAAKTVEARAVRLTIDTIVERLCEDFSKSNPRFDAEKFRKACDSE